MSNSDLYFSLLGIKADPEIARNQSVWLGTYNAIKNSGKIYTRLEIDAISAAMKKNGIDIDVWGNFVWKESNDSVTLPQLQMVQVRVVESPYYSALGGYDEQHSIDEKVLDNIFPKLVSNGFFYGRPLSENENNGIYWKDAVNKYLDEYSVAISRLFTYKFYILWQQGNLKYIVPLDH